MPPDVAEERENAGRDPVRDRIEELATGIRHLHSQKSGRGALAALRRMDEARAVEPAFYLLLARRVPGASVGARHRRDDIDRLALMTKVLALGMGIDVLGRGHDDLGRLMDDADISERRVQALMNARGRALDDLVLRLSRRLVREGSLPYLDIGRLILGPDDMVESTRRRIAKGYWGSRVEKMNDTDEDTAGGETE